jgi:hypothetical protein
MVDGCKVKLRISSDLVSECLCIQEWRSWKMSVPPITTVARCRYTLARIHRASKASSSLLPSVFEAPKRSDWCFYCSCF